ncbi:MAG: rhodanese-like domain-containing protein [Acidobacteriota bacterium]|nr:rhodanese-like domain-containing protein [Acidobacteriota bacterium]
MNKSLLFQFVALGLLAVVIGVVNNLRPSVHIDWVKHWADYSEVADTGASELKPQAEAEQPPAAAQPVARDPEAAAAEVAEMIGNNEGIADIELEQTYKLFQYAKDFTLWIDARDPDLYAKGHIRGAHLLHYYEQNSYIADIQAKIDELQPAALVIYCKGIDCTDSHLLAEDLQNNYGYPNIFVYKGGFNEWYQAGYAIDGEMAATGVGEGGTADQTGVAATEDVDSEAASAETAALVGDNVGITDIDLDQAAKIYKYAGDFTFWIDARDPELYEKGHIEGAHLMHFYEMNSYLETVQQKIEEAQPIALVLYCKGADCTDSHHLAEELESKFGYTNLFVYKGGFNEWYEAGYPIAGSMVEAASTTTAAVDAPTPRELPEEKPPGMYLEHILRDLIPTLLGVFLLVFWKRADKPLMIMASVIVGAFFIYAALPKMAGPLLFAKNIWNYDIAPGLLINPTALIMPPLELICGLGLITGIWRKGSSVWVSGMLVLFTVAVSFNVLRGHEFNCGCTTDATLITDIYLAGWNSKYMLILRDLGLLVMSLMAFRIKPR